MAVTLEDVAFGPVEAAAPPPRPPPPRPRPPPPPGITDRVSGLMVPLLATLAVVAVVLYSLDKSLEYTEVFVHNERYRAGLFVVNAVAVVVGSTVVSWSTAPGR